MAIKSFGQLVNICTDVLTAFHNCVNTTFYVHASETEHRYIPSVSHTERRTWKCLSLVFKFQYFLLFGILHKMCHLLQQNLILFSSWNHSLSDEIYKTHTLQLFKFILEHNKKSRYKLVSTLTHNYSKTKYK